MSLAQWTAVVQAVFTLVFMFTAAYFARARAQVVGREELLKALAELREQIEDRDRTAIGLRERIKDVDAALEILKEQSKHQAIQQDILVRENLGLKMKLEALEAPPHRHELPPSGRKKDRPDRTSGP